MTAANPDAAPPREFYDARPVELGDPATDPPMTVRVRRGEDRAVRYSADAVRAIRTTSSTEPWLIVAGPRATFVGGWVSHDEVRDWPVVHPIVNAAAFRLAAGHVQTGHGQQTHERGDLDVDAFKGGQS